jgi:hypothetical protein
MKAAVSSLRSPVKSIFMIKFEVHCTLFLEEMSEWFIQINPFFSLCVLFQSFDSNLSFLTEHETTSDILS